MDNLDFSSLSEDFRKSGGLGSKIRPFFPIFGQHQEQTLCYLDSAASSQKPKVVIDRLVHYLSYEHANIHRGAYRLSSEATANYDSARHTVARFLNASTDESIVFTKGATEAVNLVAHSFEEYFSPGDVILLSLLEHHSNIVPWQLLAARKGLKIEWIGVNKDASLDLDDFRSKLKIFKPRLVSVTAVSNAFGTVVPLEDVVDQAHEIGAKVLIDASQAVMHRPFDVQSLQADFLAFTGHKIYGPTGIGVLYAREDLLEKMNPFQGGGDMIETVSTEGSTWAKGVRKFEAGTPPIAEAIALGTAIDFISAIGFDRIIAHESNLFKKAYSLLSSEPGVTVYGPASGGGLQASILSFSVDGIHPHDLATIADSFNVQIRAGHHCAMPAMKALGLRSTARASIGLYSDIYDFERLIEAIRHSRKLLGPK
ncbi:MAG: cysteine desulfurase [Bdellovibrionales bacterium]|nr:cysteine desulfurase [Bdellovibrionales bacterium]